MTRASKPDHQFHLYLLGSFRLESVVVDARQRAKAHLISLPTRKIELLLAFIALHPEQHAREKLAALVWGDSTDQQARNSLRHALSILRRELDDDLLIVDRDALQVTPRFPLWVDAAEFKKEAEALLASTNPQNDQINLQLYRGDLLADFYDDWILPEREQYRLQYLEVLLRLTQTARAQSEYARAIELAQMILQNDIANERAHQHLMFAHLAGGNRAAALKQYEECRRALETELAVEPMPETTALYEWIRQAAPEGSPLEPKLTNLPIPVSSFIGRKREMAEVKALLTSNRLVTLTGAGGSGKTRLAVQVATDLVDAYRDGVWWVELAPLMDEVLVPQVVAKALGVHEIATQPLADTIASFISARQMLIVLDNCEHVVAACARLVDKLLQACPSLTILATSREGLGLPGEVTWLVPLLSLPDARDWLKLFQEYEAVRLFAERAKAVKSDFELTEQNALAVAQICRRLDGIPLAIELAAARVRVLSVEEIAARLDDRFNLLTTGSRTALPRQQTLRALIDWSHDLLSPDEKTVFRRLAVFYGGRTLDAVEQVVSGDGIEKMQVLDLLARLVDKSLVFTEVRDGATVYRMLDTIRHYAHDRLSESGEMERIRDRHLDYFLRLAEAAEPKLRGAEQLLWVNRLEAEHANLRAALEWSRLKEKTDHGDAVLRLASCLFGFWVLRGYWSEGHEWLSRGLNNHAVTRARAKALVGLAELTTLQDGPTASAPLYEEGLELYRALGDKWGIALAACFLLIVESDENRTQALFDESLTLSKELGDDWLIASTFHRMGINLFRQGNPTLPRAMFEQGLEYARRARDQWLISSALVNLGDVARGQMDYERAATLYAEGLAIQRELGDKEGSAVSLHNMAYVALHQRDPARAAELFKESMRLHQEQGRKTGIAECLAGLGSVAAARRQSARAARMLGASDSLFKAIQTTMYPSDRIEYERSAATVRAQIGEAGFNAAWEEGHAMAQDQAIQLAMSDD